MYIYCNIRKRVCKMNYKESYLKRQNRLIPSWVQSRNSKFPISNFNELPIDFKNKYFIILSYVDGKVKYNHLELRNMMEYLDFKNANQLRSKIEKKLKK